MSVCDRGKREGVNQAMGLPAGRDHVMAPHQLVTLLMAAFLAACQSSSSTQPEPLADQLAQQQMTNSSAAGTEVPQPDIVNESSAYHEMRSGDSAKAANQYRALATSIQPSGRKYYEKYQYVDRAKLTGNAAFSDLSAGNEDKARSGFSLSMEILAEGISGHTAHLEEKARKQREAANVLTVVAAVGLGVLGVQASQRNPASAQQISDSLSRSFDALGNLNRMVHNRITQIKESAIDSNARSVDSDLWRTIVVSEHPLPASVVRIDTGNSFCTGFYIQPRLVATSAHCIKQGKLPTVIHHSPSDPEAFISGRGNRTNPVLYQFTHPDYDSSSTCHPADVALLVVKHSSNSWMPIDPGNTAPVGKAMVMGYSGDLNNGYFMQLDYGCKLEGMRGGQIGSDCATAGGNSGGPVLTVRGSRLRAVAVHSCGPRETAGTRLGIRGEAHIAKLAEMYSEIVSANKDLGDPSLFR